jgi:hypothetical protein
MAVTQILTRWFLQAQPCTHLSRSRSRSLSRSRYVYDNNNEEDQSWWKKQMCRIYVTWFVHAYIHYKQKSLTKQKKLTSTSSWQTQKWFSQIQYVDNVFTMHTHTQMERECNIRILMTNTIKCSRCNICWLWNGLAYIHAWWQKTTSTSSWQIHRNGLNCNTWLPHIHMQVVRAGLIT